MKKGHALYKKVTPYIKTQHLICLNDVMNFTTTKRRLRIQVFLEQFFHSLLFHFCELNYYFLFHLLFFFEVQKV